jgi:hypothetical protein
MTSKTVATEPNDTGRHFIERNLATGHAEIRKVYEQFAAAAPVLAPGRPHPALVSGDLALAASTLTTGEMTVEIARRQADGSWSWAADQPVFVP